MRCEREGIDLEDTSSDYIIFLSSGTEDRIDTRYIIREDIDRIDIGSVHRIESDLVLECE
jgi:hypothetical protein